MGTVAKRGNRWIIRYSLPPGSDGKRRQKSESCGPGATKRDAQALLNKRILEADAGLNIDMARLPLRKALNAWLEYESLGIETNEEARCRNLFNVHVTPKLGHVRIENLRAYHFQCLIDELRRQEVTHIDMSDIRDALLQAFNWMLLRGGLERNPMEHVKIPGTNKAEVIRVHATDPLDAAIAECREKHERRANRSLSNVET